MMEEPRSAILEFIRSYLKDHRVVPSTRAIQDKMGYRSQTTVIRHLHAMAGDGLVSKRADGRWAPAEVESPARLPIFGNIPAGVPVDAWPEESAVELTPEFFGARPGLPFFGLRVRGDSMIGAGILEGDYVLLVGRPARSGDIVAALIDGESTLKRLILQSNGRPGLRAENPRYPQIQPTANLKIQGVMVGLIRRTTH